ncbi:hypothetical protein S83_038631 [Arachis hypogaea]
MSLFFFLLSSSSSNPSIHCATVDHHYRRLFSLSIFLFSSPFLYFSSLLPLLSTFTVAIPSLGDTSVSDSTATIPRPPLLAAALRSQSAAPNPLPSFHFPFDYPCSISG